jgi:hypothetical protein
VPGTVRGLHYQLRNPQAKLVSVLRGAVLDVAVDIRRGSPTFGRTVVAELSEENRRQLFIPEGFAHGFRVLTDTADFFYKCTDFYAPGDEYGVLWNDPDLAIPWGNPGRPDRLAQGLDPAAAGGGSAGALAGIQGVGDPMLAKVYSGAVFGVDAYEIEIEVNAGHGEPKVVVVGLPDAAVKESSDRVWTALINSGFAPPMGRTTVNLAPADIKKEGPSFDLPIALGMLASGGPDGRRAAGGLLRDGRAGLERRGAPGARGAADRAAGARGGAQGHPGAAGKRRGGRRGRGPRGASGGELCARRPISSRGAGDSPFAVDMQAAFGGGTLYDDDYADVKGRNSRAGRSRWRWRAGTTSCWSARRARANPCWPSGCRPFCRR